MYRGDHGSRSVPAGVVLEVFVRIDVAVMIELGSYCKPKGSFRKVGILAALQMVALRVKTSFLLSTLMIAR